METALVVGGTRFLGRHTVVELREHGYDVTVFNRGRHDNPFGEGVGHVQGDRTDGSALRRAAEAVDPDLVVDCVAYHPGEVRTACEVFADCDAYVYVSSGAAYGAEVIPKREDETALHDCPPAAATDDSWETYGQRKAEGDRAVFAAADRGVRAMSVRPPVVYGPHDYTERFDYWIDRVRTHDRVLVPGDGTNLRHLVYVGSVARAVRTVAESGTAGEAYNVGDRHLLVLEEWVERIADALGAGVEVVHASERDLAAADLSFEDFRLYRSYPHVLATGKLASLGWEAVPVPDALEATVEDHRASDRTGRENGPPRAAEERVIAALTGT